MKNLFKYVILPLFALGILLMIGNFVIGHFTTSEVRARNMPMEAENGMKHAYAACQLHTLLRNLGFSRPNARGMVLGLGIMNEFAERVLLFPRDTTLEIRKDLLNNLYGVELSEWLESQPLLYRQRRLTMISTLAQQGILVEKPEDTCGMDKQCDALGETTDPMAAARWFNEHKTRLSRQANGSIEALRVKLNRGS